MKVLLYLDRPDELDTDIEMYPMPVQRPFFYGRPLNAIQTRVAS